MAAAFFSGCQSLPEETHMAIYSRPFLKDEFSGPKKGEAAPRFVASTLDGKPYQFPPKKGRPILLVTGSYTCPIFRANIPGLRALHRDFGEQVDMFYLYTTEAHPVGSNSPYRDYEWVTRPNKTDGVLLDQPTTFKQRLARAQEAQSNLYLPLKVLIDGIKNPGWKAYGQAPSAAYLTSPEGSDPHSPALGESRRITRSAQIGRTIGLDGLGKIAVADDCDDAEQQCESADDQRTLPAGDSEIDCFRDRL